MSLYFVKVKAYRGKKVLGALYRGQLTGEHQGTLFSSPSAAWRAVDGFDAKRVAKKNAPCVRYEVVPFGRGE